jgi:hypothetical protein
MVFSDDRGVRELRAMSGDVSNGMTVVLAVPVQTS